MTEKAWQKILITGPGPLEETIAAFVTEQTGNGVEIQDDKNNSGNSVIIGYLPNDEPGLPDKLATINNYLTDLAGQYPDFPPTSMKLDTIANEDWHRKWKESFKPFHLTDTIVIKPSWESYTASADERVIEIDPGMAFGTGLHASTRLAMELLEYHLKGLSTPPAKTLDVGTGTGILAIGAALFGCPEITAIDIDPDSVAAAGANIAANNLTGQIAVSATDLNDLSGPFNLIIANIIHNTLIGMAPALTRLLAPNGILIMAGILKGGQAENITATYHKHGLIRQKLANSGEWSALSVRKD